MPDVSTLEEEGHVVGQSCLGLLFRNEPPLSDDACVADGGGIYFPMLDKIVVKDVPDLRIIAGHPLIDTVGVNAGLLHELATTARAI